MLNCKGRKRLLDQKPRSIRVERVNGATIEVERGWLGQIHFIVTNHPRGDGSRITFPVVCRDQKAAHNLCFGRIA